MSVKYSRIDVTRDTYKTKIALVLFKENVFIF